VVKRLIFTHACPLQGGLTNHPTRANSARG
jgi:hypothetical protein